MYLHVEHEKASFFAFTFCSGVRSLSSFLQNMSRAETTFNVCLTLNAGIEIQLQL